MNARTYSAEIVKHLSSINGEQMTSVGIGAKFAIGPSASRQMLDLLAEQGLIRVVSGRQRFYYVPTKEMIEAENRLTAPRVDRPLKIDPHRTELYARLAKDRQDMPTKYGDAK